MGQNNKVDYSSPVQIAGTTWAMFGNGTDSQNPLVIKSDGTAWAWGNGDKGQLSQNNTVQYSSPVQIPGTTWKASGTGTKYNLISKTDVTLWAVGENSSGQLGQNTTVKYSSPVQVGSDTTWWNTIETLSSSGTASATIKTDGTLWLWGNNQSGALGLNNNVVYSSPIQITGGGTTWSKLSIAGGGKFSAIKTDGTLWAWGYNCCGKFGQN